MDEKHTSSKATNIAIILCTYNGGKYLNQQIDSILNQTCLKWTLYIRDDGSSDDTVEIIKSYCKQHSKIVFIEDEQGNLGPKNSFMHLLASVEAKYYMFCDQDDVWLPEKIEISMSRMKNIESLHQNLPILVHTDLEVVGSDLNRINGSFWKYSKIKPGVLKNFNFFPVCNFITGCTMLFNDKAKIVSYPVPSYSLMHDSWVAANVIQKGIVSTIRTPTILYRQHEQNEIGASSIRFKYFLNKALNLDSTFKKHEEMFPIMSHFGYGSIAKFYFFKVLYTLIRNF
jgi:glycosyltransferase involved in cell wall biosynthesis